jgi:hypothetical protein
MGTQTTRKTLKRPVRKSTRSSLRPKSKARHHLSPAAIWIAGFVAIVAIVAAHFAFAQSVPVETAIHLYDDPKIFAEPTTSDEVFASQLNLLRLRAESAAITDTLTVPIQP